MARNRKRAKERQARRPQRVGGAASRIDSSEDALDPLAHAAPDVELADAQLALGRPELTDETPADHERNEQELEEEVEASEPDEYGGGDGGGGGAEVAVAGVGRRRACRAPGGSPWEPVRARTRLPARKLARATASTVA